MGNWQAGKKWQEMGEDLHSAVTLDMGSRTVDRIDWSYDSSEREGKEVVQIWEVLRFLA